MGAARESVAVPDRPCSTKKCKRPATHMANGRAFCCECYEQIVNRLLEMLQEIREAVK